MKKAKNFIPQAVKAGEAIRLVEEALRAAFQAGLRRGYSQRSKMAGAQGTDEPDEDTYIESILQR